MLKIALSLIFSVLAWKYSIISSILVPLSSFYFLKARSRSVNTLHSVTMVLLFSVFGLPFLRGSTPDPLVLNMLSVSMILAVPCDFFRKRKIWIFDGLFWFFISLSLYLLLRVKYSKFAFLIFPVVALIFIRDIFRKERDDAQSLFSITDEGAVDGRDDVQEMVGSGDSGSEGTRKTEENTQGNGREDS